MPQRKTDVIQSFCNNSLGQEIADWKYGKCLVANRDFYSRDIINENIIYCIMYFINTHFYRKGIKIVSDTDSIVPSYQYILGRGNEENVINNIMAILNGQNINLSENSDKIETIFKNWVSNVDIVEFQRQYKNYFAYGCRVLNINHRITANLFRIQWEFVILKEKAEKKEWAIYNDRWKELPFCTTYPRMGGIYYFNEINQAIREIGQWMNGLLSKKVIEEFDISFEDFVPGTIERVGEDGFRMIEECDR